jgi:alginate O-acetyltransferase complex protein AlgI
MNLYSPEFFGFFIVLLFIYYTINPKAQKFLLLLASSFFIAMFSVWFLGYTYLFILVNYLFALSIDKQKQNETARKIICNVGIMLNILSLVFFKYTNFIIDNLNASFHLFNQSAPLHNLSLIVPIGISYYTFQGISYILQVYREHEKAEKDILVFSNYILLFPKFLAGPIELSKDLIPQLKQAYVYNYSNIIEGFQLILWGAFKKMVIADRLAMLIRGVYSDVHVYSGNPLLIAFLLQPLHLYCDFSGYTDIALGIGRAFGLKLTNNFNRPFFSTSVTVFWRRWHISLSSWCNEFIFKRLSFKKRKWGLWASVYAVFVTFFIIGIWHGPTWNFIILGILQGLAINYEFFTKKQRLSIAQKLPSNLVLYSSYGFTYLFICLTLIFFNASSLSDAMHFISHMFVSINIGKMEIIFLTKFDKIIAFTSLLFLMIIEFRQEKGKNIFVELNNWPKWTRYAFYYSLIILIIYFGSPHKEFIYMKF